MKKVGLGLAAIVALGVSMPASALAANVTIRGKELTDGPRGPGLSAGLTPAHGTPFFNDVTRAFADGTYNVYALGSWGSVIGSFTVAGDQVVSTTGALYESAADVISFDRSQLARVEMPMAAVTAPVNQISYTFAGNNFLTGDQVFYLPAGTYRLSTLNSDTYGTLTIGADLVPSAGTGAILPTPNGFALDYDALAAVDVDWGDATLPRGGVWVGIVNVLNFSAFGQRVRAYLPPSRYRVHTRAGGGIFGWFEVTPDLQVVAETGLFRDESGVLRIDPSVQSAFRLVDFSNPASLARPHLNEFTALRNVDLEYFLPPASYRVVHYNGTYVPEFGRVVTSAGGGVSTTAGLVIEGGLVSPDPCAHHVISFTPASSSVSYRIGWISSAMHTGPSVATLPAAQRYEINFAGISTRYFFDLDSNGPSQRHFPSEANPLLVLDEISCMPDDDDDGVDDTLDNCLGVANPDQSDADADGVGDVCDVCEGDDQSGDTDADFVCDAADNCPLDPNEDQADADADGRGDACELDGDEDGLLDDDDNCPADANPQQENADGDAEGDACDADDDGDGVADALDNCALVANAAQLDADADGQGDECDGDDDADGVLDEDDVCPATPMDVVYDEQGCSGAQLVALSCGSAASFANHGQYVRCVAQAANAALDAGLLSPAERAGIVRGAAKGG